MNGRGRPLRFVALVAAGWAGARVAILWPPGATLPDAMDTAFPVLQVDAAAPEVPGRQGSITATVSAVPPSTSRSPAPRGIPASPAVHDNHSQSSVAALGIVDFGMEQILGAPPAALPRPPVPSAPPSARPVTGRWSASAWFVTRRGAPASGPMLGGDQAGVRVAYAPEAIRGLAVYTRVSAPLAVRGRELGLGVEWRPGTWPVRLVAEHRIALDGMKGGAAFGLIGGVGGVALPLDFSLEAYGQAGVIARQQIDPFADGALRVTRDGVAQGRARLALGMGIWGAAQREATRIDIGPSAVAILPLGNIPVRVALDWRQRIAGRARPGSGPALTLGADF